MKVKVFCPVHDYSCPYYDDDDGVCIIEDPYVDCDEFMGCFQEKMNDEEDEDEQKGKEGASPLFIYHQTFNV